PAKRHVNRVPRLIARRCAPNASSPTQVLLTLRTGPAGRLSRATVTRSGVVGSGAAESYERQALTARGAKYRIAIPMTRTCGRALSYVAVIRSVSPAGTGRPAESEKPVIATGPGSCMTGRGSMPPQTGYDVKTEPQFVSVTSTERPPPWRCAPPATITPLSGATQSACCA